jgi:hypothetical protein
MIVFGLDISAREQMYYFADHFIGNLHPVSLIYVAYLLQIFIHHLIYLY